MAFRTWVKLLGAVLGVATLAGASQLGVAYGLGILRPARVLDAAARDQWTAQLAWVAWIAMTSAVLGALAGDRLRDRLPGPVTTGTRIAVAVAAGAGAAIVVPLTMQPARTALVAGVDAVSVIGWSAAFGALVGVFAGYAVLAHVVARWSVSTVAVAIWVIAIVSVLPSLGLNDTLPAVRLGVFDAGFLSPAVTQRTALVTMPALALLVGAAHGWAARRREMPTLTIALAGLPGPALLTVSYLIAGPGSGDDRYQIVPYWAAMTATGAGLLGSVLAAVVGRGDAVTEDGDRSADATETGVPGPGVTALPADTEAPLPATSPSGRRSSAVDAFTGRTEGWPVRRREPAAGGGVALGEHAGPAAEPFDAFAAADPERPAPSPSARPDRQPLVPEPRAVSAPLPQPEPISPPLTVTPAPERHGPARRGDDEFVDWVSGLGRPNDDDR